VKKIGFFVQQDFLTAHFGVRNYFSTIMNLCSERYHVDYLIHEPNSDGLFWYIADIASRSLKRKGKEREQGLPLVLELGTQKKINSFRYTNFDKLLSKGISAAEVPNKYHRSIGENLAREEYDLIVITNPWIVNFDGRLPAKKVVGLVYDLIPNQFALTGILPDFVFAHQHNRGFQYYNKYCDEVYAISKIIADLYNEYYNTSKCKFFPPFPPYGFHDAGYQGQKKENAVLLAAPFDQRKGIEEIPELINGAADLIDTLYIYGMPRCTPKQFDRFFKELSVQRVVYCPYIETVELIQMYQKCKLLLFPSWEEGLGFPIIEAQVCGCRVITTDKPPMNQLVVPGSYLLDVKSTSKSIQKIRDILKAPKYQYEKVSQLAWEKFSYEAVQKIIEELLD
jgi:glycosyltransferase involved in cell wall biosynthesis